jgi:hypothetical protein
VLIVVQEALPLVCCLPTFGASHFLDTFRTGGKRDSMGVFA